MQSQTPKPRHPITSGQLLWDKGVHRLQTEAPQGCKSPHGVKLRPCVPQTTSPERKVGMPECRQQALVMKCVLRWQTQGSSGSEKLLRDLAPTKPRSPGRAVPGFSHSRRGGWLTRPHWPVSAAVANTYPGLDNAANSTHTL